jgi:NAD(P)-dependent dehydrogenase (short-subunit alcohol dehydrogenase family)
MTFGTSASQNGMLQDKVAIVYGAGGPIGSAISGAFAHEGAFVHLAGRTPDRLEAVAEKIRANGGRAEVAVVDALDEAAVDRHADAIAASAGRIDISCNVIRIENQQGTPLLDMTLAEVETPVHQAVRTHFLTMRAAGRHMVQQGNGVILTFGGHAGRDPLRDYQTGGHLHPMGGYPIALEAVNVLRLAFANELGPRGVRVVGIETSGVPETMPDAVREFMEPGLASLTMLKQAETLADVGNAAVFAASDRARHITGSVINITGGNTVS